MLSHIHIVLVGTTHPGNIGAVARAMKNMRMTSLRLVAPKIFPSADATSRASGADDLLSRARVCDTLREAIADCQVVFGASARSRTISWPELTPRQCADEIFTRHPGERIAIVFGREHSGLTNEELDMCRYLLHIPCNPHFSSLNLAAAVQVVCYELFVAAGSNERKVIGDRGECPLATAEQMESFYDHLHETLVDIDFAQPGKSESIMRRLRRIYNRIELDTKEVDILRGILRMSQGHKKSRKQ
ncbi:RNA methyltransferase [Methylomicrobium album]|uniref:tRNA (cytidine/uridine-2'-O-)-methyltransferase TrmJ n=1 Tax=Methylomicrobium album BG8 TaxID=686340 RepID=H8GPE6_METAL|nr:RNA methyltransferase [Methylomicrobium album]EIC30892.1 RNA methyltransferase, TrmH family, group 1 [Methylomicrobium album BG8]